MRYRGKTELTDRLASEYVLGTLRGKARLRFQAWMREDAAIRRSVAEWEERLAPLAIAVEEVRPPKRVWRNIESQVRSSTRTASIASTSRPRFWDSLGFWRGWGLIATGLAAVLIANQVLVRQIDTIPAPTASIPGSFVATLDDARGNVAFVLYAAAGSNELRIKPVAPNEPGADRSYELWGLTGKQGEAPKSLGVIPAGALPVIKLTANAERSLADFPKLAISLEPAGGSKTGLPTGPVLFVGDSYRM